MKNKWLHWARELQSLAQAGLTFSNTEYDRDRYQRIRDLSVEILHEYTGIEHNKIANLFASGNGYQTPKVDVRAAVINNGKVLLVKEKIDGKWSMPGGWADVNSSPSESAIRECLEEAGANVIPRKIIAIHMADRHNTYESPFTIYKIFIECKLVDTQFKENTETLEADFFDPGNLPPLSESRTTADQVRMCIEAQKQAFFETVFD